MDRKTIKKLEQQLKYWKKPAKNYMVWKIGKEYKLFDIELPPELIGLFNDLKTKCYDKTKKICKNKSRNYQKSMA